VRGLTRWRHGHPLREPAAAGRPRSRPAAARDPAVRPFANGKLKLVGVEYWKADADQKLDTREDEPTLLDQPFGAPMEGHAPGMPVHYDLHVWLFKDNPAGMFAPFNPTLTCPPAAG
jgi:hypothetical protein